MQELILGGKLVAVACSAAGLYYMCKGSYLRSAVAWNTAAMILWCLVLAA